MMNRLKVTGIRMKIILIFSIIFLLSFTTLIVVVNEFSDEIYVMLNTNEMKEATRIYVDKLNQGQEPNSNHLGRTIGAEVVTFTLDGQLLTEKSMMRSPQPIPPEIFESLKTQDEFFIVRRGNGQDLPKGQPPKGKTSDDGSMYYAMKTASGEVILVIKHLGIGFEAGEIYSNIVIWSSVIIYILSILAIIIITRQLTKPILKARDITANLAKMDLQLRLDENRNDELGELNRSINIMASELANNFERLNEANESLGIELSKERTMDKMRRRFVADVSHELKNPITMIQGYADALIREIPETPEEKRYYYETISDEAGRMDVIVRDLLDLSAYESGTFKMTMETFDIAGLTRNILARFTPIATEKNVTIKDTLPESFLITGDYQRMGQVLVNLMSNAFKHVPESGHIKLDFREDSQLQVALTIGNTGDLIPSEDLEHIFESFYRADSQKKGHGLGLAIVKSIIHMHHGTCKAFTEDQYNYFEIVI